MRFKKTLCAFLSAVYVSTCTSAPVTAYEELDTNSYANDTEYAASKDYDLKDVKTTADGLKYVIRGKSIEMVGCEESVSDVVIPAEIDGLPVTAIGDSAFEFRHSDFDLKSITLPDTIISIGDNAFRGSYSMTTLTIPKSVKNIGIGINADSSKFTEIKVDKANPYFTSDNGVIYSKDMKTLVEVPCAKDITSFTVPDSVTEIYGEAFCGCSNLESIDVPESVTSIGKGAFKNCSSLKEFDIPKKLKEIPGGMLSGCSSLTEIIIPDGVEIVGGAFGYCTSLEKVIIPDSVTSIGNNAFYECCALESISFPDSITELGTGIFIRCFDLANVKLPANITEIPSEMFAGCGSLKNIDLPESVNTIRNSAFYSSGLEAVTIPGNVKVIEYAAFQSCADLERIIVSEDHIFTHLGDCAFGYGTAQTKWYDNQPDGYVYIGRNLYHYKGTISKNDNIAIKEGTVTIGSSAFSNQVNLKNIKLPQSLRYINDSVFLRCTSLNKITFPENLEGIGDSAFAYSGLTEITIPESVKCIEAGAFNKCENLQSFTIYSRDCILTPMPYSPDFMLPTSTLIYGYTGSTAEEYSKEYNRTFVPLDDAVDATMPCDPQMPVVTTVPVSENPTEEVYTQLVPAVTTAPIHCTESAAIVKTDSTAAMPTDTDSGIKVNIQEEISVPTGVKADKYGDANTDNKIDISDAVKLNLFLLDGSEHPMKIKGIANSDCCRDEVIDSSDSTLLINYITMMIDVDALGTVVVPDEQSTP